MRFWNRAMAISAISSSPQLQLTQASSLHRHGRSQASSLSDVDAQSSNVAPSAPSTGRVGKKLDVTA
jgi:hypothetical protein